VLDSFAIVGESATRIARRVDDDALDLAGGLLFERLEGKQVVAEDEAVVEGLD